VTAEPVQFITVEEGDDLIVSFAIDAGEPGEIRSLTLMRNVKWAPYLPPDEQGVRVGDDEEDTGGREMPPAGSAAVGRRYGLSGGSGPGLRAQCQPRRNG